MRLIDAERIEDFAYEPEFGTKDVIEDWIEETNIPFDVKVEYEEELRKLCWKVIQGCMNITKTEPTVYDIEKVVAELKEWTFNADVNLDDGIKNSDLIASENAIAIVKRGIISDDDVCEWKHDAEFKFAKSQCGFIDTHRIDFRKFKYCPYCGKKIKVVEQMFNLEKQKEDFVIEEMIDRIIDKLELVVEKMKVVGHSNGYWTIEEHEQIIDWLKELKLYRLAIKQCKESSYMVNSKEFARHMEEWVKEQLKEDGMDEKN